MFSWRQAGSFTWPQNCFPWPALQLSLAALHLHSPRSARGRLGAALQSLQGRQGCWTTIPGISSHGGDACPGPSMPQLFPEQFWPRPSGILYLRASPGGSLAVALPVWEEEGLSMQDKQEQAAVDQGEKSSYGALTAEMRSGGLSRACWTEVLLTQAFFYPPFSRTGSPWFWPQQKWGWFASSQQLPLAMLALDTPMSSAWREVALTEAVTSQLEVTLWGMRWPKQCSQAYKYLCVPLKWRW